MFLLCTEKRPHSGLLSSFTVIGGHLKEITLIKYSSVKMVSIFFHSQEYVMGQKLWSPFSVFIVEMASAFCTTG